MSMPSLSPLLAGGQPVDWWLAFKFNAATYSGSEAQEPNPGLFGGTPVDYGGGFSLSYALASSANPALQLATGYLGTALSDPLGATFNQIYQGDYSYVLWNDQFYGSPMPSQDAPWGHSKGVLAWDSTGAGLVLQVTSPSWPASGSARFPRAGDGNTLGCVHDDDVMVSQHFFALKLSAADVAVVLAGLADASIVTRALPNPNSPTIPQVFNVTGPASLAALAQKLGALSSFSTVTNSVLSTGVTFIVKPSLLHVPPWQMVSAQLGGLPIRAATWWTDPAIPSTDASTPVGCWDAALGAPGAVQIATTGTWQGKSIGLEGGEGTTFNHAKIGVSMDSTRPLCIFGDMNQQGTLSGAGGTCGSSQNGRGGTFYVLENQALWSSLTALLNGESAPLAPAAAAPAAEPSPAEKATGPKGPVRGPRDR